MSRSSSRWDRLNFLRNSITLGGAQILSALLSALLFWWLKKVDSDGRLGQLVLCITVNQLLLVFVHWTQPLYIRDGLSAYSRSQQLSSLFLPRLAFSLGIGLLVWFSSGLWSESLAGLLNSSTGMIRMALLFFLIQIPFWHVHNSLQSVKLVGALGSMLVIDKSLTLIAVGLLWWFSVLRFETALLALVLGNACAIAFGLFSLRRYIRPDFPIREQWRHVRTSFPLIGSMAVAFLTTGALDQFFIRLYLREADFVDYFLLYQFYGMFLQIPTVLSGLLLNWISSALEENNTPAVQRFFGELLPGATLAFAALAIPAYLVVSCILVLFYQVELSVFALPLLLLMISAAFSFANIIAYAPYMLARRQVRMLSFLPFLTAAINVLGNSILVLPFGLCGIASASFFAATLTGVVVHFYVYKDLRLREHTLTGLAVLNILTVLFLLVFNPAFSISVGVLLGINLVFGLLRVSFVIRQAKELLQLLAAPVSS